MNKRRAFKDILIDQISKRLQIINNKLAKFDELNKERVELYETLKRLTGNSEMKLPDKVVDMADVYATPPSMDDEISAMTLYPRLPKLFSIEDVLVLVENNKQKTYQFVGYWKRNGFTETVSRGNYRKLKETN